jgi:hypothetical protein
MLDANQAQGRGDQRMPAQPAKPGQGLLPPVPPPPPVPESREELDALAAKRHELENQLETMTERREDLADQLDETPPAAIAGLAERIRLLDERSARLEREILLTDDAIAAGIAKGLGIPEQDETETTEAAGENEIFSETAVNVMIGEALAFVLLGIFFYRWTWRRARERFAGSAPNDPARMDQLQNAVDAIALEVERISEGQRYVTRMLGEGAAQPAGTPAREEVLAKRNPV